MRSVDPWMPEKMVMEVRGDLRPCWCTTPSAHHLFDKIRDFFKIKNKKFKRLAKRCRFGPGALIFFFKNLASKRRCVVCISSGLEQLLP